MADTNADAGKRDKSSVNYRRAMDERRCGNCVFSYGPTGDRRCRRVKGQIHPEDTCDLFKEKR